MNDDATTTTTTTTTTNATPHPGAAHLAEILARAARFRDRGRALRFADGAAKRHAVVLGDDGRHWVVTPADASRLERMGYEVLA
jgi:hypothetical protein